MLPLRNYVLKSYLEGSVFDLRHDVDFLYRSLGWDSVVDAFRADGELPEWVYDEVGANEHRMHGGEIVLREVSSADLPGQDAQRAHRVIPVQIRFGFFHQPSLYHGIQGDEFINLGLPTDILNGDHVSSFGYKGSRQFVDQREIRHTIEHELTHWVDDAVHNKFVSTRPDESVPFKGAHAVLQYPETQAFVHEIRALRDDLGPDWDDLSVDDMLAQVPNLAAAIDNELTAPQVSQLKRNILSRLHREHLLGRSMR